MKNNIAINFIYLRKRINLHQPDLADILDVSRDVVSAIENNKKKTHDISVLQKFCSYFKVSIDDLVNQKIELQENKNYYVNDSNSEYNTNEQKIADLKKIIELLNEKLEFRNLLIIEKDKMIDLLNRSNNILNVLLNQNNTLEKLQIVSIIEDQIKKASE